MKRKTEWATFTMLTPQEKTLVSIDVERAWSELPEDEFIRVVESVLPDDMVAKATIARDGTLRHLSIQSTTNRRRRFRVKPGQQLICDREGRTAAALFRRDVDNLYEREEFHL